MPIRVERSHKSRTLPGERVLLVPYEKFHVPRYHEWMSDPQVRYLTGSEPLTLEEEYAMQKSWALDGDKITFIILDRAQYEKCQAGGLLEADSQIAAMVGDVNIFFSTAPLPIVQAQPVHNLTYTNGGPHPQEIPVGECEVMIGSTENRRKGFATQALEIIMDFAFRELDCRHFLAKIKRDNETSLGLFRKFAFSPLEVSEVFNEVTLWRDMTTSSTTTSNNNSTTTGAVLPPQNASTIKSILQSQPAAAAVVFNGVGGSAGGAGCVYQQQSSHNQTIATSSS